MLMRWLQLVLAALCLHNGAAFVNAPTSRVQLFTAHKTDQLSWPRSFSTSSRHRQSGALQMFDATSLFELQTWAGNVAASELTHVSPLSIAILYGTGLLMSFSPCALSLLPLTVGYIVGTEGEEGNGGAFLPSAAFAGGLAAVLSVLGLSATYAGKLFGSASLGGNTSGLALPLLSATLAIAAGLNLLELVNVNAPSLETSVDSFKGLPRSGRAFVLGASSALVASPCCTPVLASILGFVATSQDPALGLALLLAYSLGYTTPLMVAGTASGALSGIMSASGATWITPLSAAVLISYGTFTGLGALFGSA
jgi:cytochrome c-type biogenesis protein